MLFFKSKEQKEQKEQEQLMKKFKEYNKKADAEERYNKLQERLAPLKEERNKSACILKEIYERHGIKIIIHGTVSIIDSCYLADEVIDDLCLFNEEERKSLHKWAKVYKDCERIMMNMLEEYKKEEDEHRINDNM